MLLIARIERKAVHDGKKLTKPTERRSNFVHKTQFAGQLTHVVEKDFYIALVEEVGTDSEVFELRTSRARAVAASAPARSAIACRARASASFAALSASSRSAWAARAAALASLAASWMGA